MTFDAVAAKKRAQLARKAARQAVFSEINTLVPSFAKTNHLVGLILRLEAAAEHHGRMKERVGRDKREGAS